MRLTIPFSLIILAVVAAYLLKPSLPTHQAAADAWLENAQADAASRLNLGDLLSAGAAATFRSGTYEDLIVLSRYTITLGDEPFLQCWGVFGHVSCNRVD